MKAEQKAEKEFVTALMYALKAPFITWPQWEDVYERHHVEQARIYRLAQLPKIMELKQATEYEAMMYIHSASLGSGRPLPREADDVYFHLFRKYFDKKLCDDTGIPDPKPESWAHTHQPKRLQEWIFKHQIDSVRAFVNESAAEQPKQLPKILTPVIATGTLEDWFT